LAERQSPRLPKLIAPEAGEIQAFNHLDKSATYAIDEALADADPGSYDALVLPGGAQIQTSSAPTGAQSSSSKRSSPPASPSASSATAPGRS